MIRVRSANAWKENLHWINNTNFNRLKEAGLVRPGKIVQAVSALKQKVPVKAIKDKVTVLGAVSYYMPNFTEYSSYFKNVDKHTLANAINRSKYINILNLRKGSLEEQDIVLPLSEKRRLRKQDYNKISKIITKRILENTQQ